MQANEFTSDPVNSPSHYMKAAITIEPIELTARLDSCLGQALQYVFRAPYKGNEIEDLRKAIFYLEKEIDLFDGDPYANVKIPGPAIPYISVFRRYSSGLAFYVLGTLFTFGYGGMLTDVDRDALNKAIAIIDKRINELTEGKSDAMEVA